jgi:gliding motility-associated-like protein
MKKYNFLIGFFLLFPILTFCQSGLVLSHDTSVCKGESVVLNAYLNDIPGNTSNYSTHNIPFNLDNLIGSHSISLLDDDQSGLLNIGFNFCYFGQTYSQFIISSNGWLGFSINQPNNWTGIPIPNSSGIVPQNVIMCPWQDLDPRWGGNITYELYGTAPYRRLVLSYNNIPYYASGVNGCGVYYTGQIKIFETTNIIETHILNKPVCMSWNSGFATHGLHNLGGNSSVVVNNRNNISWTAASEAIQFVPAGQGASAVNWYCNGVLVGTGNSITVQANANCTYKAIANYGCGQVINDTDYVTINVSTIQVQPAIQQGVSCFNTATGSITAYVNGNIGAVNYSWNTVPVQNTPTAIKLAAGVYTITVLDQLGCSANSSITLISPPKLQILTDKIIHPSCWYTTDGSIDINAVGGTPPYYYNWSNYATTQDINNLLSNIFSVAVRDDNKCSDTILFDLKVDKFYITAGQDLTISFGNSVQLEAVVNPLISNINYVWSPSKYLNNHLINKPIASPNKTTTFTVVGTNENSCVASDEVTVNVIYDGHFPIYNAFTPNNDGENDYFTLQPYADFLTLKHLKIFNRWGKEIFKTANINNGWDGSFKGEAQEVGTYVYEAEIEDYNGGKHLIKGNISLLR